MALIERLIGTEEPKLAVHTLMAALSERKRGNMTAAQIVTAFNLSQAEQTEAATIWNRVNSNAITAREIEEVLLLAETRTVPFDTPALVRARLGI